MSSLSKSPFQSGILERWFILFQSIPNYCVNGFTVFLGHSGLRLFFFRLVVFIFATFFKDGVFKDCVFKVGFVSLPHC